VRSPLGKPAEMLSIEPLSGSSREKMLIEK